MNIKISNEDCYWLQGVLDCRIRNTHKILRNVFIFKLWDDKYWIVASDGIRIGGTEIQGNIIPSDVIEGTYKIVGDNGFFTGCAEFEKIEDDEVLIRSIRKYISQITEMRNSTLGFRLTDPTMDYLPTAFALGKYDLVNPAFLDVLPGGNFDFYESQHNTTFIRKDFFLLVMAKYGSREAYASLLKELDYRNLSKK